MFESVNGSACNIHQHLKNNVMKKKNKARMQPLQKLIFITVSLRHFYETLLSTRIDKVQIFLNMMIVASLASAIAAAQVVLDERFQQPAITVHRITIPVQSIPVSGTLQKAYIPNVTQQSNTVPANIQTPTTVSFWSLTGPDAAMATEACGVPSYTHQRNTVPPQISPVATGLLPGLAGEKAEQEKNYSEQEIKDQNNRLALPRANAYGRSKGQGS
jgi:hypothetical protein